MAEQQTKMNSLLDSIGFVGAGRMAQALARGLWKSRQNDKSPAEEQGNTGNCSVYFIDPNDEAATQFIKSYPAAARMDSAIQLAENSNVILLAVKPQIMPNVLQQLKPAIKERHLIVSVAAGISIEQFNQGLETNRVVRVMPNTPCLIGQGMSALASDASVSNDHLNEIDSLLQTMGQVVRVDESDIDAVTGLSGSGPAYVFTMIQAMIDGGTRQGLDPKVANTLAVQTVLGAASLVQQSSLSPAELTAQVTSPGGTTLAGLEALRENGFTESIDLAVAAATSRSIELSKCQ